MRLLLLAVTLAYAHGAIVGVDQCAWGPSYWCSHISHAKACGAVKHCTDTVWRNTIQPKADGEVCQMCEALLKDVDDMLQNQEDQKIIIAYMQKACAVIPVKSLADECDTTVTTYFPEIAGMLAEAIDPVAICGAMNLCPTLQNTVVVDKTKPISKKPTADVQTTDCADCKKFLGDVQAKITSNETKEEIKNYIDQALCQNMGALETLCDQVIEKYLDQVLELLASEVDPALICNAIGFCPAVTKQSLIKALLMKTPLHKSLKAAPSEYCLLCHTVFEYLQVMERSKATQEEIEQFIETSLCSKLGQYAAECNQTVEQYAPLLFELISSELDPNEICKMIGFCQTSKMTVPLMLGGEVKPVSITRMTQKPKQVKVKSSTTCVMCEFVLREVDSLLKKNASEQEIVAALDKVCRILPSTISDECKDFVDQYGPAVIDLLAQELDPSMVCSTIGLCSSSKKLQMPSVKSSELCGICETVVQYVDSLLEENATVTEIEAVLEKVCNFLPGSLKSECDDLVKQYGPLIISLLQQEIDPPKICGELGLCNNTVSQKLQKVNQPLLGVDECTYGPVFWCKDMNTAKQCNAVAHCSRHVWNN
ncbi:unnamed protein product [Owenia fusiformis]|uniref:Pulmonary surfactant-associated protein B n=1 Tax=Owenia fusiformis TaxID=6347 RepID=A0A8S4PS02_OWEFU|nr:unnamed protein product [Owenia fusiformis]